MLQSYYERLAGIAEAASQAEPCDSSATRAVLTQPKAPQTTAVKTAKPPLPRIRRCTSPVQQEQVAPLQPSAQSPLREPAAAAVETAAPARGSRSAEQSCVSGFGVDRPQAAAVAKQQSRVESKLRARLEELQVLL